MVPLGKQQEDVRRYHHFGMRLPLRTGGAGLKARGATPGLTVVKHELREWIESRLSALRWDGVRWNPDPTMLQEQLNGELSRAELFCGSRSNIQCPEWSELGYLAPIALDMKSGSLLVVTTAVGIQSCGDDESAYAYESNANEWRMFWQTEQNDYEEGKYVPQRLGQVLISPTDYGLRADKTEHLILTLGVEPWCSASWHPLYYRVWQTKAAYKEPLRLLDGSDLAHVDESIQGSVKSSEVVFEYYVDSVESGFRRPEIRHYILTHGALQRIGPVALTPHDFTAFWLRHPWEESSFWTAKENLSELQQWRQQHKGPLSEFGFPARHCERQPDLWQVDTDASEDGKEHVYFLMRWLPPYNFTMLSASDHPMPDCNEEDRGADSRSLFSVW